MRAILYDGFQPVEAGEGLVVGMSSRRTTLAEQDDALVGGGHWVLVYRRNA